MQTEALLTTPLPRGPFRAGALACIFFAIAAVLLRGIRWDETYEHAQILAGIVSYPPGHPLAVYVHNAFSLQTYFSAALLKLGVGPALLCGVRNVLFLLATMLPVYTLVCVLSRSVLTGLLTTLLLLQGILLEFDGSYPTMVWPEIYSNGHIGGGVVLLALCAFLVGRRRSAWFMLGLIPAIHVGQWPPLLGTLLIYAAYLIYVRIDRGRRDKSDIPKLLPLWGMAGIGFLCSLVFYGIQQQFTLPLPDAPSFGVAGDVQAVWQGYTALHDPHRQFPPGNGQVILVGTLFLCALGALFGRDDKIRRHFAWLSVYVGGIAAAIWITMVIHAWYGAEMPFLLIAWMPYRLLNHIPPICLAVMAALILSRWPLRGWWILGGATLAALCLPYFHTFVNPDFVARYLADGTWIAFGLFGAALLAIAPKRRKSRQWVNNLKRVAIIAVGLYHHFGAACILLGLTISYLITRKATREPLVVHPILMVPILLLIVGTAATLHHQFTLRQNLIIPPFEGAVAKTLQAKETPLLLASPDSIRLQATTGFPVLTDAATPSLISYVPEIGPAIDQLYRAIYGFGFAAPAPGTPPARPWETVWKGRSTASWQALAKTYGFTHVVAPVDWSLNLSLILAEEGYGLYAIRN